MDICAIARPGGNQIIFKPEIIFFIIVTDSIFFLSALPGVCVHIYIINIKEILYLSWDGKMREGYVEGGVSYSSHSADQQESSGDIHQSLPFPSGSLSFVPVTN